MWKARGQGWFQKMIVPCINGSLARKPDSGFGCEGIETRSNVVVKRCSLGAVLVSQEKRVVFPPEGLPESASSARRGLRQTRRQRNLARVLNCWGIVEGLSNAAVLLPTKRSLSRSLGSASMPPTHEGLIIRLFPGG